MKITVLGAGAWGTALAIAAAANGGGNGNEVRLWARNPAQSADMRQRRENLRYLPGAPFPERLQVLEAGLAELPALLAADDLVVIATPMAALRDMLTMFVLVNT